MPSLMDELRADQGRPTQCTACAWIKTRPPAEQAEWHEAMRSHSAVVSHASIHRAIIKRIEASGVKYDGPLVGRGSVEHHRKNAHGPRS